MKTVGVCRSCTPPIALQSRALSINVSANDESAVPLLSFLHHVFYIAPSGHAHH